LRSIKNTCQSVTRHSHNVQAEDKDNRNCGKITLAGMDQRISIWLDLYYRVKSRSDWNTSGLTYTISRYAKNSNILGYYRLKLYNVCMLPIMLYGSECWALSRVDTRKVDALDQWCLRRILDIRWYHHVSNCEVRRLTEQPPLTTIIQKRRLTLFGHLVRMDESADARRILTAVPQSE